MSQLLERAPRFSSGTALLRHYQAVRMRMSSLSMPTQRALPSPEMMARGNPAPAPMAVPIEIPKIEEPPPPEDTNPIPDQRRTATALIERLGPEIERMAIRQTIELFYERLSDRGGRSRALLLRSCTAAAFRVSEASIIERRRCVGITRIRQTSMALMGCLLDSSLPDIGRAFAGRDHTTVIHAKHKMTPLVMDVLVEMYDGKSCPLPPEETPEQDDACDY